MKHYNIYPFSSMNPKRGIDYSAWGVLIKGEDGATTMYSQKHRTKSTYKLDILALISAFQSFTEPITSTIYTNDKLLDSAFNDGWLIKWRKNDFRHGSVKKYQVHDVEHKIHWVKLCHSIRFHQVKLVSIPYDIQDVERDVLMAYVRDVANNRAEGRASVDNTRALEYVVPSDTPIIETNFKEKQRSNNEQVWYDTKDLFKQKFYITE